MSLNANDIKYPTKKAKPLEAGTYPARVVGIISYGLQEQKQWDKGEPPAPRYELKLIYELTTEFLKDEDGNDQTDKPRWVWANRKPIYAISEDKKERSESKSYNTQQYNALDPTFEFGGDYAQLIGKDCLVTLVNEEGKGEYAGCTFTKCVGFTPTMKGMDIAPLVNEPFIFDTDNPDMKVWKERIHDKEKKVILKNLEFRGSALEAALNGDTPTPAVDDEDDRPF